MTNHGRQPVDTLAEGRVANEDRLLASLGSTDLSSLARLLRALLLALGDRATPATVDTAR